MLEILDEPRTRESFLSWSPAPRPRVVSSISIAYG